MLLELFRILDARLLREKGGLDIVGLVQALVQWRGSTPDELGIDRRHSVMLSVPGRAQSLIGRGRTGETAAWVSYLDLVVAVQDDDGSASPVRAFMCCASAPTRVSVSAK